MRYSDTSLSIVALSQRNISRIARRIIAEHSDVELDGVVPVRHDQDRIGLLLAISKGDGVVRLVVYLSRVSELEFESELRATLHDLPSKNPE